MDKYYPVVVIPLPAEDGPGYMGLALDLMGCISHGDTPEEAFMSVREAVREWVDEARENGREVPEPGTATAIAGQQRVQLRNQIKRLRREVDELRAKVSTTCSQDDDSPEAISWTTAGILAKVKISGDDFVH